MCFKSSVTSRVKTDLYIAHLVCDSAEPNSANVADRLTTIGTITKKSNSFLDFSRNETPVIERGD